MIISNKSRRKKPWIFLALAVLAIPLYSKADEWLWKIDKQEYSIDEFSKDYKSYLQLMALQMGTSGPALQEYVAKAGEISDPRTQAIVEQLRPEVFGESFITISLLKRHAIENKYFEKPDTQQIEKFLHNYIMLQLYLNNIVSKFKVEISDEEIQKEWLIQKEKNENYKTIPIEQGLHFTRQKMTADKQEFLRNEFIKSLFEKYKVEKNADYKKTMSAVKVKFD